MTKIAKIDSSNKITFDKNQKYKLNTQADNRITKTIKILFEIQNNGTNFRVI